MKVSELIEKLKEVDPSYEVSIYENRIHDYPMFYSRFILEMNISHKYKQFGILIEDAHPMLNPHSRNETLKIIHKDENKVTYDPSGSSGNYITEHKNGSFHFSLIFAMFSLAFSIGALIFVLFFK